MVARVYMSTDTIISHFMSGPSHIELQVQNLRDSQQRPFVVHLTNLAICLIWHILALLVLCNISTLLNSQYHFSIN